MQEGLQISYIGHATSILEDSTHRILTDPHFGASSFHCARRTEAFYDAGTLPEPDLVLLSHVHPDHLNIDSYKYLRSHIPIIVPIGSAGAIHPFINNPIIELAHWVPHTVSDKLTITPVPVRHIGGRYIPGLRYRTVNAYIIQMDGKTIYFAGDTTSGTHFREVGNVYEIDVALLPVGGIMPRWLTIEKPLDATDLLQAMKDLRAKHMLPIHWGTFTFSKVADTQVERLRNLATEKNLTESIHIVSPGNNSWQFPAIARSA